MKISPEKKKKIMWIFGAIVVALVLYQISAMYGG